MAKEATLQIRIDADLKENVEELYRKMGTTFAEAVRIFARQSIINNGMPIVIATEKENSTYGRLAKYANPEKWEEENSIWEKCMVVDYEKAD